MQQADNSVKNKDLYISNPKSDLHNIPARLKFGENTLIFTVVIFQKRKYGHEMKYLKVKHILTSNT